MYEFDKGNTVYRTHKVNSENIPSQLYLDLLGHPLVQPGWSNLGTSLLGCITVAGTPTCPALRSAGVSELAALVQAAS